MTDLSLMVEKTIKAPIERVFNAWLDPEMIKKFMVPMEGAFVRDAVVDARVGGQFAFVFMAGENEIPHKGTYHEITPHSRLVFGWQSPHSADDSVVTLNFKAINDKETYVVLEQQKFLNDDAVASHKGGWTSILDTLAATM